ncbi:MAG: hypothetical protein H0V79_09170 [Actinobacteria bacterium]|nr:hypothetical protein [Actinomycetota bacterium]
MGRVTPLLTRRVGAFVALAASLGVYYAAHGRLDSIPERWELAFLAACLIPAVFSLVYLVLPLRRAEGLFLVAVALLVLTVMLDVAGFDGLANFSKLALMTAFGFWFLSYFESVLWVALVALIIPVVDSLSVWRGPTRHIVDEQPEIFDTLSFAFPAPGGASSANLGLPDLLFFALFLAAAARWELRVPWTWVALTASLGLTMISAVALDTAGLPALPGLAFGFLIPNGDLLWREFRRWRASRAAPARQ